MFLISCPVTHRDELVSEHSVRAVTDHPTHIALTVACPCGHDHVYRTGRRWEQARARVSARQAGARAAREGVLA